MENLIGQIAKLPDGTKVRIKELNGTNAVTVRIEGPNKGIPAFIDVAKLKLNCSIHGAEADLCSQCGGCIECNGRPNTISSCCYFCD